MHVLIYIRHFVDSDNTLLDTNTPSATVFGYGYLET